MKKRIGKTEAQLKIIRLRATNFFGLENISLNLPTNGLIQITGKNGAGKTTLLRIVDFLFRGGVAIDKKLKKSVIRQGTTRATVSADVLDVSDPNLTRTYKLSRYETPGGKDSTDVIDARTGQRVENKGQWLADVITELTFDPLKFAQMSSDDQAAELRRLQLEGIDLDFEAMEKADEDDIKERAQVGAELKALKTLLAGKNVEFPADLPRKKIDTAALFEKLSEAEKANQEARELAQAKFWKKHRVTELEQQRGREYERSEEIRRQIEKLRQELEASEMSMVELAGQIETAEAEYNAAPEGKEVDTGSLRQKLQKAESTNANIALRQELETLSAQIEEKDTAWNAIDTRISEREWRRKEAYAMAKLPIDGLTFDQTQVYYKTKPLASYGEGEQIRISTLLGMEMNPGLKCMCIQHGEALDEDGLKVIADLAVKHDFQVLMARVETSGEIGVFMENGAIKKIN